MGTLRKRTIWTQSIRLTPLGLGGKRHKSLPSTNQSVGMCGRWLSRIFILTTWQLPKTLSLGNYEPHHELYRLFSGRTSFLPAPITLLPPKPENCSSEDTVWVSIVFGSSLRPIDLHWLCLPASFPPSSGEEQLFLRENHFLLLSSRDIISSHRGGTRCRPDQSSTPLLWLQWLAEVQTPRLCLSNEILPWDPYPRYIKINAFYWSASGHWTDRRWVYGFQQTSILPCGDGEMEQETEA